MIDPAPGSVRAFVALGSNVGDRAAHLAFARQAIDALPGTRVVNESSIEVTPPFGPVSQPPFLNQMLELSTSLDPQALLDALLDVERRAGRDRASAVRWGPRTLDCDIVLYDERAIDTPTLTVPHPGLLEREFWIRELGELGVGVGRFDDEQADRA